MNIIIITLSKTITLCIIILFKIIIIYIFCLIKIYQPGSRTPLRNGVWLFVSPANGSSAVASSAATPPFPESEFPIRTQRFSGRLFPLLGAPCSGSWWNSRAPSSISSELLRPPGSRRLPATSSYSSLGPPILLSGLTVSGVGSAFLLGILSWRAFGLPDSSL